MQIALNIISISAFIISLVNFVLYICDRLTKLKICVVENCVVRDGKTNYVHCEILCDFINKSQKPITIHNADLIVNDDHHVPLRTPLNITGDTFDYFDDKMVESFIKSIPIPFTLNGLESQRAYIIFPQLKQEYRNVSAKLIFNTSRGNIEQEIYLK